MSSAYQQVREISIQKVTTPSLFSNKRTKEDTLILTDCVSKKCSLRIAAFVSAISKIATAYKQLGISP
jgi:hypothetical protein